jgi:hypothetical protein
LRRRVYHITSCRQPLLKVSLLAAFLVFTLLGKAQTAPSAINQVKAVFLYNFTQFVTWPPEAFADSKSPFVIGVLGNNPFGPYLEKVVEGETVSGRSIVIRYFSEADEVRNCHLLFINKENPREALMGLAGNAVLTVGDRESFIRSGGMIGFYVDKNKIRFYINTKTARAANINISSKLLRLANVIEE